VIEGWAKLLGVRRSAEDFFAERIRVELGGKTYTLPVRSVRDNREWLEALAGRDVITMRTLDDLDDPRQVMAVLSESDGQLLDALISYDEGRVLPSRDDIEAVATNLEIYRAAAGVWLAANPKASIALGLEDEAPSPTSTSTALVTTAGLPVPSSVR
jgi:hypothetical protein